MIQDLIQPLQWTVEVDFHPTGSARDILSTVISTPALHKAKMNAAHLGQLVGGLEAMTH